VALPEASVLTDSDIPPVKDTLTLVLDVKPVMVKLRMALRGDRAKPELYLFAPSKLNCSTALAFEVAKTLLQSLLVKAL
jgi:hypothetical protein